MTRHLIKTAALAIAAVLTIGATTPRADWTGTVNTTPTQTHVMGNPDAKVKVTEFLSYTCSHCAHFHKESEGMLRARYIASGKVSVEVQHLVRDPIDLTVAMLANCGTPRTFARVHNAFLQTQDKWMPLMGKATDVQKQRWTTGPVPQRMQAIARDFGFYPTLEAAGVSRVQADQCLADEAMMGKLLGQTRAAMDAGVTGTPSFMINGTLLDETHDWATLNTAINQAI